MKLFLSNLTRDLNYFYENLSTMAAKQVMVYNTKTEKTYPIHPAMAKEPAWLAARGLIIQESVKPFEVTNLEQTDKPKAKK